MERWQQVVDIGHLTAKIPGVTKLVNHLTSKDMPKKEKKDISPFLAMEEKEEADVVLSEPGNYGMCCSKTAIEI